MRIGIIGSGFGLYGLLPAFNSIKGCTVVALCGKKTDRLVSYCASIGLKNIYTDWQDMLEQEELDAIAIAVIPSAQYEIAKAAIKRGLHVFAEKPLAANLREARALLLLARKKKVTTAVDFIFPEIPEWQKAESLLKQKAYGRLEHFSVEWDFESFDIRTKKKGWKTDAKAGGGALAFYASHVLYYAERYAGRIKKLEAVFSYAKESRNGAETGIDLDLVFLSGATGNIHVSCNAPGMQRHSVLFIGTNGALALENQVDIADHFTLTAFQDAKTKHITVPKLKNRKGEDERVKIVHRLALRFVAACRSQKAMTPSFADGVRVEELIDMIRRKAR